MNQLKGTDLFSQTQSKNETNVSATQSFPPPLDLPSVGHWVRVSIPKSYQPTYLSPSRFIVRIRDHGREFGILQGDMDEFYSIANFTISKRSKKDVISDERLVKGALFAAFVKDLKAYSRVIVKAKHEGKEAIVFLPDHGFFCAVKIRQMWELEPRFKRLPFQAFAVSLPIESPGLTDRWSNEAVKTFKEAVSGNNLIGRISAINADHSALPSVSVVFSEMLALCSEDKSELSEAKSGQMKEKSDRSKDDPEREKVESVIDVMVAKCFAKKV